MQQDRLESLLHTLFFVRGLPRRISVTNQDQESISKLWETHQKCFTFRISRFYSVGCIRDMPHHGATRAGLHVIQDWVSREPQQNATESGTHDPAH